jgi:hypothetical protein
MLMLVIVSILTIPLSQAIAALIHERDWVLILFPVGEALFCALCGYWLLKTSPQAQLASPPPVTPSEIHHRPA